MTEQVARTQTVHRWYTRPVLFVADVNRAIHFYVDMLGFEKSWHEGDGAGTVCQAAFSHSRLNKSDGDAREDCGRVLAAWPRQ